MKSESLQIIQKMVAGQKLWFVKKGNEIKRFSHKMIRIDSDTGKIKIGIHRLPTPVFISSKNSKSADLILSVPFEDYLEGVIAGEMSPSFPLEALKAQAVAARSYTLYQLSRKKDEVFQLQGDVLDQVYSLNNESAGLKKIKQALDETRGQVLVQNQKILKAYYHSDCGGVTEEPQNVWGVRDVGFGVARDKKCSLRSQWNYTIKKSEMAEKLGLSSVKWINVVSRSSSQRVMLIAMGSESSVKMTGQELRQTLGFDKIKSTLFSLTETADSVTFLGRGSGHGSGLCQWGSRDLAREGLSYEEILSHYYPHAQLTQTDFANQATQL